MQKLELKNRKGLKIVGVLETQTGTLKGTCIIQHGWGGHRNKDTIQAIKNAFLESGFQTFNFDTTHSFGESEGDFEQSTLRSFSEDFEDVVEWSKKQDWFIAPLALSGHSKGGYSTVKYAEDHSDQVDFLVPVAPVVSGELSFEAHRENNPEEFEKWQKEGVLTRIGSEGDVKVQHWSQMTERLNHNLIPNAQKLRMPILFIVGSEDTSCPPKHIQKLMEAIPEGNKTIEIMEGSAHSFHTKDEQENLKNIIKDWLSKQELV